MKTARVKHSNDKSAGLLVRHYVDGRFVRGYKLKRGQHSIGSSRHCLIRTPSGGVSGVAAVIEKTNDGWMMIDVGSEGTEQAIGDNAVLEFGPNKFEIEGLTRRRKIFSNERKFGDTGKHVHVVRWKDHIIETTTQKSEIDYLKNVKTDDLAIDSYQLPFGQTLGPDRIRIAPEMRKPTIGTFSTLLGLLLLSFIFSLFNKEEEKPGENVYTKMIYDSKVLAQRRQQLVSSGFKSVTGTGNGNGSISEGAKAQPTHTDNVVNSLRKSGIQSVIGKIAARASKNAIMISALNMGEAGAPGTPSLGALNQSPSNSAADGKTGVGADKGYKVAGIGTGGKGGGTGDYKAGTGLGTGSIGNGEVGLDEGDSSVEGGLDRDVIAGVIKEHLGQVRYCYERELAANPKLAGKVKVRFTIDGGGQVISQAVSQSTLGSTMVEECILRRIASWKFPVPRGGVKVIVSYPFLFKSVN